jgi:hypothetical protein
VNGLQDIAIPFRRGLVQETMAAIWVSRRGMSESELLKMLNVRITFSPLPLERLPINLITFDESGTKRCVVPVLPVDCGKPSEPKWNS